MTEHPDIDELFAADDDEQPDDADPNEPQAPADPDEGLDPFAAFDDAEPTPDRDDAPPTDPIVELADDDGEDLLALVDEASARYEPVVTEPTPGPEPEPAAPTAPPAVAPPAADRTIGDGAGDDDELVLQFPSQDFPPPPVFRLRVPQGWLAVPVPDALMAVRRPDAIDDFHPNVLVRSRRIMSAPEPGLALAELAELETVPEGMELLGQGVAPEGATPARWVEIRFAGPQEAVLRARHLLVYVPATLHVANVLSVVGTWPDEADDDIGRDVTAIVGSLRLYQPNPANT